MKIIRKKGIRKSDMGRHVLCEISVVRIPRQKRVTECGSDQNLAWINLENRT